MTSKVSLFTLLLSAASSFLLTACASDDADRPSDWEPRLVVALDTGWKSSTPLPEPSASAQVLVLNDASFLVADGEVGTVNKYDSLGNLIGAVVTPGSGPRQARPPFVAAVQHDTLFLTSTDPFSREVTWVQLSDLTSGRHPVRIADAVPIRCVANLRCLVHRERAWAGGLPVSRAGETIEDTLVLGVSDDGSPPNWFTKLPGPLLVGFEWPNGPAPIGIVAHEYAPGSLVSAGASLTWTYRDDSGTLCAWDVLVERCEPYSADFVPRTRVPLLAADSTEKLLEDARTPLARNRIAASRDLRIVPKGSLPRIRRLVPGVDGTTWLELSQLSENGSRLYLRVENRQLSDTLVALPVDIVAQYVGHSKVVGWTSNRDGSVSLIGLVMP